MSSYEGLAASYDALTTDVGYEKRADFLEKLFRRSRIPVHTVLDLACGTGTMTWLLTDRGYELIGVDGSEEMLAAAMEKSGQVEGIPPIFLHQSMPQLDLYGTVDAAICCLDSLNYLTPAPPMCSAPSGGCTCSSPPAGCWCSTSIPWPSWRRWMDRSFWTRRRTPTASGARSITGDCVPITWISSTAAGTVHGSGSWRSTGSGPIPQRSSPAG